MYIPPHFAASDATELAAFIRAHPFGQLISLVDGRPFVSHIPFLINEHRDHLVAHVAYQNPQWEGLEDQEVLVVFQGQNGYVSPSLFSSPGVPTWNYQAVHVYGKVAVFHDADEKHALVEALTHEFESRRATPWEPEYKESMLRSIVGLDLEITRIEGKFKLSQNRPQKDLAVIARDLAEQGCDELAARMMSLMDDQAG